MSETSANEHGHHETGGAPADQRQRPRHGRGVLPRRGPETPIDHLVARLLPEPVGRSPAVCPWRSAEGVGGLADSRVSKFNRQVGGERIRAGRASAGSQPVTTHETQQRPERRR